MRQKLLLSVFGLIGVGYYGVLGSGENVVNLLPGGPLELYPNNFDDDNKVKTNTGWSAMLLRGTNFMLSATRRELDLLQVKIDQRIIILQTCTTHEVLGARYSAFALPSNSSSLSFLVDVSLDQGCQMGVIFGVGPIDVSISCSSTASLVVDGGALGLVSFPMPQLSSQDIQEHVHFVLTLDNSLLGQRISLCTRGAPVTPDVSDGAALFSHLAQLHSSLLSSDIIIGSRDSDLKNTARVRLDRFLLRTDPPAAVACPTTSSLQLTWSVPFHKPPQIVAIDQVPQGDIITEQEVRFISKAVHPEGLPIKFELTVYGLPPDGNDLATGGDAIFSADGPTGSAHITTSVRFPLPGKYLVRARASGGTGTVISKDISVLVRKIGDLRKSAPCCRHTSYTVTQQLGRPIHQTEYRGDSVASGAERLGWSPEYLAGPDMEAERLFDYSVLAPPPDISPLRTLSCADTRLAGAGTPVLYGVIGRVEEVSGHNKALAIVPEAFPWAEATDVECREHWSGWEAGSTYARTVTSKTSNTTSICAVGCSKSGTELLIRTTGMFDHYNQALIQASYGALSLSPQVTVLPEVEMSRDPIIEGDDAVRYYTSPARLALESQPGPRPWMNLVLTPLITHQLPDHRAWSGGMVSGGAVITMCFAHFYYAVHETGHRLGFKHINVYKLDSATSAPSDPLGDGSFIQDAYSDSLDIMGCCKGDYSLYQRTMAGWVRGSKRELLTEQELIKPSERRFVLWPFDRSESRGQLLSVALRRSPVEVLLIGFRSASHWQEAGGSSVSAEDARQNVRGLQVEYMRRIDDSNNKWNNGALVDLNVVHGDWPDALPPAPKEFPKNSQFALLKEGYSWYDPASKVILMLEKIGECPGTASLELYNYTARDFYGFRGEWPFKESMERADYGGYASLECAHIAIVTGAEPPKGQLYLSITALGAPLQDPTTLGSGSEPTSRALLAAVGAGAQTCSGFASALLLSVSWYKHSEIRSLIWKDGLNRTLMSYSSAGPQQSVDLPRSAKVTAADLPVSVHVLAWDGRHTRAEISKGNVNSELIVKYKLYEHDALSYANETLVLSSQPECQSTVSAQLEVDTRGLIIGMSIASVALLIMIIGSTVWLVRWMHKRKTPRRRTISPNNMGHSPSPGDHGKKRPMKK